MAHSTNTCKGKHVGLSEIAAIAGVPRQTAYHWTKRESFPEPTDELAMGKIWDRADVVQWYRGYRAAGEAVERYG
jgi:predicted DNA-binding transcriptional regulator AlpA